MLLSDQFAGPPVAFLLIVANANRFGGAANGKLALAWAPPDASGCFAESCDHHLWLECLILPGEDIAIPVIRARDQLVAVPAPVQPRYELIVIAENVYAVKSASRTLSIHIYLVIVGADGYVLLVC